MTDSATHPTRPELVDRYASFETAEEEVVVYDRKQPNAWISSDVAFDVGRR
jgi:hypothetical protein